MGNTTLVNFQVPAPIRLSLMWATLMSLYIYNDFFSLFLPGEIEALSAGQMGPLGPATASILVFVSLMMAIPASMIFLSSVLPPVASRWLNIFLGAAYTLLQFWSLKDSPPFYVMVVAFEIIVTGLIIWTAWRWPRA